VLVVDDNSMNTMILSKMLEMALSRVPQHSVVILVATNGQEAFDTYKRETEEGHSRVGLVLMDCEMPVMDGYESTRRIRDFE
jgi:CheY-like chemotaxis protein